jgi:arylsulfatase A-like enzyme
MFAADDDVRARPPLWSRLSQYRCGTLAWSVACIGIALIAVVSASGVLTLRRLPNGAYAETSTFAQHRVDGPNIVLISVDTLRPDRLGCYGYDRDTSPTIDALAARGARFTNVVAESSWTLPSHVSMLTGLYPSAHKVTRPSARISEDVYTMAEVLKQRGYRTLGFTAGGYVAAEFGFDRGFDVFRDDQESFSETIEPVCAEIESLTGTRPYFAFLHTYDVHCPYDPPERYAVRFRSQPRANHIPTAGKCGNPDFNQMDLTPGQIRFLSDQYDAEIRELDDNLRSLFDFFDQRDAWDDTIVVLVSDHGEEFGEHGQIGHQRTLYIEALRVPWLVAAPGLNHDVIEEPAGLIDVMPTLLDLVGVPFAHLPGRPLLNRFNRQTTSDLNARPLFSELDQLLEARSVIVGPYHLIVSDQYPQEVLFDLTLDPAETQNLAKNRPDMLSRLRSLLETHERSQVNASTTASSHLSDQRLQQLRSLGYVD